MGSTGRSDTYRSVRRSRSDRYEQGRPAGEPLRADDRDADREADRRPAFPVPVPGLVRSRQAPISDSPVTPAGHGFGVLRRRVTARGECVDGAFTDVEEHDTALEKLIAEVDVKTDHARAEVLNRPLFTGLDTLRAADGYVARWVRMIGAEYDVPGSQVSLAAPFGYAVESLTCDLLGATAKGWALTYQVAEAGTRPDIVAVKDRREAWIDLTADSSSSQFHIYATKSWNDPRVCPFPHAEIGYRPFDQASKKHALAGVALERAGTPRAAMIDVKALDASLKEAKRQHDEQVAGWKKKFQPKIKASVPSTRGDVPNRDELKRSKTYGAFNTIFKTTYPTAAPKRNK